MSRPFSKVTVDNVGEVVLCFRREFGIALVAATLFMAYAAAKVNISNRFIDFFPAEHKNVILAERFHEFGGAQTLVLMLQVKQGDIFNLDTLRKIQEITEEVDWLPGVNHQEVFSLSSYRVAYAQAVPGGLMSSRSCIPRRPRRGGDRSAQAAHLRPSRTTAPSDQRRQQEHPHHRLLQ